MSIDQEVETLARETERPSLTALSYALRHPETWPADFVWDYRHCETCAVGLATRLWSGLRLTGDHKARRTMIARAMAMPYDEAGHIFFGLAPIENITRKVSWFRKETVRRVAWETISPDDVADAIDDYLAEAV